MRHLGSSGYEEERPGPWVPLGQNRAPSQAPWVGVAFAPFFSLVCPTHCLCVARSALSSPASPLRQGLGNPALTGCTYPWR